MNDWTSFYPTILKAMPSPNQQSLDITQELAPSSPSTFFFRVGSVSYHGTGIEEGDILVVDRAVAPYNDCKAVCFIDGGFCVRRVDTTSGGIILRPINEDDDSVPVPVAPDDEITIFGVVTWVIQKA